MIEEETRVLPMPTLALHCGRLVKRYWMQTAR
jgi:hypothetical protein